MINDVDIPRKGSWIIGNAKTPISVFCFPKCGCGKQCCAYRVAQYRFNIIMEYPYTVVDGIVNSYTN